MSHNSLYMSQVTFVSRARMLYLSQVTFLSGARMLDLSHLDSREIHACSRWRVENRQWRNVTESLRNVIPYCSGPQILGWKCECGKKRNTFQKCYGIAFRSTFIKIIGWKRKNGPKHPWEYIIVYWYGGTAGWSRIAGRSGVSRPSQHCRGGTASWVGCFCANDFTN